MEDIWKFILYALAVGLYYFIMGRKKTDANKSGETPTAKPFMSPAAKPQARPRPVSNQPQVDTSELPTSLEDLLRRFQGKPTPEASKPEPMLKDKVKESKRKLTTADRRDIEEKKKKQREEVVDYDDTIPTYENEAADVDYEVPEKANYQGLDKSGRNRFEVFEQKAEVQNPYANLLKNPESIRTAFILSEILKRKEF
jgi:hypothetical protein